MGKDKLVLIITIIVIIVIGIVGYFKFYKTDTVSPVSDIHPTQSPVEELAEWVDQSEFSFQYPKSLTLDPHEEDQENYAHVELTSSTHPGSLIVWAKDTGAPDVESWVKQTKTEGAIDSILGDEQAKKVITDGEQRKMATAVIRNGYLYQIEVNLADNIFWSKIYDTVSSTFKFIPSEVKNVSSGQSGTEDEEYTSDEEIIE